MNLTLCVSILLIIHPISLSLEELTEWNILSLSLYSDMYRPDSILYQQELMSQCSFPSHRILSLNSFPLNYSWSFVMLQGKIHPLLGGLSDDYRDLDTPRDDPEGWENKQWRLWHTYLELTPAWQWCKDQEWSALKESEDPCQSTMDLRPNRLVRMSDRRLTTEDWLDHDSLLFVLHLSFHPLWMNDPKNRYESKQATRISYVEWPDEQHPPPRITRSEWTYWVMGRVIHSENVSELLKTITA